MGAVKEKWLEDLDQVSETIYEAGTYGLTSEVILTALNHIIDMDGQATVREALEIGMKEWDL